MSASRGAAEGRGRRSGKPRERRRGRAGKRETGPAERRGGRRASLRRRDGCQGDGCVATGWQRGPPAAAAAAEPPPSRRRGAQSGRAALLARCCGGRPGAATLRGRPATEGTRREPALTGKTLGRRRAQKRRGAARRWYRWCGAPGAPTSGWRSSSSAFAGSWRPGDSPLRVEISPGPPWTIWWSGRGTRRCLGRKRWRPRWSGGGEGLGVHGAEPAAAAAAPRAVHQPGAPTAFGAAAAARRWPGGAAKLSPTAPGTPHPRSWSGPMGCRWVVRKSFLGFNSFFFVCFFCLVKDGPVMESLQMGCWVEMMQFGLLASGVLGSAARASLAGDCWAGTGC